MKPDVDIVASFRGGRVINDTYTSTVEVIMSSKTVTTPLSDYAIVAEQEARELLMVGEKIALAANEDAVTVTSGHLHIWWVVYR